MTYRGPDPPTLWDCVLGSIAVCLTLSLLVAICWAVACVVM